MNKITKTTNGHLSLFALCLGFFMVIMDATIVNVSLPTLVQHFHSTLGGLQWVLDSYTLMFAGLLLSAGHLADHFGAKRAFLTGLLIFTLASLGCGLAPSLSWLIIFRFIQGAGAALVLPTSLALINGSYNDPQERAKAVGMWGGMGAIAGICGPVLGGVLTAAIDWRAIFLVNVPIGILGIWLTWKYVAKVLAKHSKGSFDLPGQLLSIISMGSLAFSFIEGGETSFYSERVIISFMIFLISFILFLIRELKTSAPMLPLALFKSNTFSIGVLVGMVLSFSFYGELFIFPLYFEQIRGYSVMTTALALAPLFIFSPVVSYMAGKMMHRIGAKQLVITGLMMGAFVFFSLITLQTHSPSYLFIGIIFAIFSIAGPIIMVSCTMLIIRSAPPERSGIASAAFNASRQFGTLMGVAVCGAILNGAHSFISGMHITLILAGSFYLVAAIITILGVRIK